MAGTTFDDTIDWNKYWNDADEGDRDNAGPSAELVLEPLCEFLGEMGAPDSYADVGCGPGDAVFDVATRHPDASVTGYDVAEPVLAANRERASEQGIANLSFEQAVLPAFDPDRQFDVVSSFYTLCYVHDVDRALRNLYDAVVPAGYLLLTYHNRYSRSVFRGIAESPDDHLDESSPWKPERFTERFQLLLDGENLLSYDRIHEALGTWPQSVWSVAEDAERYPAWRHNPLVYVPK